MRIRRSIRPKSFQDAAVTTFVVIIIPVVFCYEICVVLPRFYKVGSLLYYFHMSMGLFIFYNVVSNFVGVVLCDTSIVGKVLPSTLNKNWRFCAQCESVAPPRSWHCNICKTCILKRDHHCIFTGCCIGHFNFRYFIGFVFYTFVGTLYACVYNVLFMIDTWNFTYKSLVNLVFPLAMLFVEMTVHQLYVFLMIIVMIGCLFTGVLLYINICLMFKGVVTYESNHDINIYDLGPKRNVMEFLGERWYIAWLSPLIQSKLPSDGINFETPKIK